MDSKHNAYVLTNAAPLPLRTLHKYVYLGRCAFPKHRGGNLQAKMQEERLQNLAKACSATNNDENPTPLPPTSKNMEKARQRKDWHVVQSSL